jgi:hypothetical protein
MYTICKRKYFVSHVSLFLVGFLLNGVYQRVSGSVSRDDLFFPAILLVLAFIMFVLNLPNEKAKPHK